MKNFSRDNHASSLDIELQRVAKIYGRKPLIATAYIALWTELIHDVWINRCKVLYQNVQLLNEQVCKAIVFSVAVRLPELASSFLLL